MIFYYLFLLLAPFQQHPKLGAVLFNVGFVPVTLIKIVGLVMVASAMLAPSPTDAAPRMPTKIPLLYGTFVIVPIALTVLFGLPFPQASASALFSYGLLLVATRLLVSTSDRILNVGRVLVFAEAFGSLWLYKQQYILHELNPNGPSGDSNYEALSIVMTIPLALYVLRTDPSVFWRRLTAGCAAILTFAVFVSQSRGGILALGVLMLLAWLRAQHKLRLVVVSLVGLSIAAALAPSVTWQRFHQIQINGNHWQTGAELSTRTRIELWRGGFHIIETHPFFGIGLDQFKSQVAYYNPNLIPLARRAFIAHDTYIQVWAEDGIGILLVFLAMIWLAASNCRLAERLGAERSGDLDELALAMRFGLIAFLVGGLFLSAQLVKTLWMFVFLSPNLREIVAANTNPAQRSEPRVQRPQPRVRTVSQGYRTA
jgi:putative inorganic carbon (hco3(-)) transporter